MPRPICATIYLQHFTHNLSVIRQFTGQSKIWSVVKANAYGHGIDAIWPALAATDGFALLDLNEAIKLRNSGWIGPILLLEGFFQPEDIQVIEQYNLMTSIHHEWQLDALEQANVKHPIDIYVKLNSGMNRLGFKQTEYESVIERLKKINSVGSLTLMAHFANSDNEKGIATSHNMIKQFEHLGLNTCVANSGALLWHPQTHYDWIRTGIVLYGGSPSGNAVDIVDLNLKATMSLTSEIIAIFQIEAGESIGYGSKFTATQPMRIATVACGYADGYPRHAPTGTPVWVNDKHCGLLGTISMDMLTIDISDCPEAQIGTAVELWGENLSIDIVAKQAGTIGYELMCALAQRVPICYQN
nr:alanine racemase [uncultured Moellerella sp.]